MKKMPIMKNGLRFDSWSAVFFPHHKIGWYDSIVSGEGEQVELRDFVNFVLSKPEIHEEVRSDLIDASMKGRQAVLEYLEDFCVANAICRMPLVALIA